MAEMDLEEFKRRLLTEPGDTDPAFSAARNSSTEHARAARESDAFEQQLAAALRLPVRGDLADDVLRRCVGKRPGSSSATWLSIAAVLVAAVALALVLLPGSDPAPGAGQVALANAFIDHYNHPEPRALIADEPMPAERAIEALVALGAHPEGAPGAVTYISPCAIGGVRGLHLVTLDEQGRRVTLMFVPNAEVERAQQLALELPARMIGTASGAVAVFVHNGQDVEAVIDGLFADRATAAADDRETVSSA